MKVVRRLGKGNKVEELMLLITEDVQLVVSNYAVQSMKPEQNAELEDIVKRNEVYQILGPSGRKLRHEF